ncbi:hypothetical protein [Streptomyces longisporoflavus]|uniref:Uncharacterized protein n=1 Tax=Streptomyces longisporoflavus TaxID=28044 RepID=A0ABW7QIP8_9ACTN
MEQPVVARAVRYAGTCQDCDAELECRGVQVRAQLLSEHGAATLRVVGPSAKKKVVIMRVLRAELGIGLMSAKAVLGSVLNGDRSGTLPETELLARKLRASGIAAEAARSCRSLPAVRLAAGQTAPARVDAGLEA